MENFYSYIYMYLPWLYFGICGVILLFVSIFGALLVSRKLSESQTNSEIHTKHKQKSFFRLWLQCIFKLRSIYTSIIVHIFDIVTDWIVTITWYNDKSTRTLAVCSIGIFTFHTFLSTIAFYSKEKNIRRTILQFFNLLVFEEIYFSHLKVIRSYGSTNDSRNNGNDSNKSNNNENESNTSNKLYKFTNGLDSTYSFKYIRFLEASFESTPQAILQCVYLLNINGFNNNSIVIISILQSIYSITNSLVNNDLSQMKSRKYKKNRKRFPPSKEFLKHFISRMSQVISRIGILALSWIILGGYLFGAIILSLEFVCVFVVICESLRKQEVTLMVILEFVSLAIALPLDTMFNDQMSFLMAFECLRKKSDMGDRIGAAIFNVLCCYGSAWFLSSITFLCQKSDNFSNNSNIDNNNNNNNNNNNDSINASRKLNVNFDFEDGKQYKNLPICGIKGGYNYPSLRIGLSLVELIIVIIFDLCSNSDSLLFELGSSVNSWFIITIVFFLIETQYVRLIPQLKLPGYISVQSIHGRAFLGDLEELQRIKPNVPSKKYSTIKEFWDQPIDEEWVDYLTPAMFALANKQYDTLKWLELQGAHNHIDRYIQLCNQLGVEPQIEGNGNVIQTQNTIRLDHNFARNELSYDPDAWKYWSHM